MNQQTFKFKGTAKTRLNDVIYDGPAFNLLENAYTFKLAPKSKFWRFGIRLSTQPTINFDLPSMNFDADRHRYKEYIDIQLEVGRLISGQDWQSSNSLALTQNHLPSSEPVLDSIETYSELTDVQFKIKFTDNQVVVSFSSGGYLSPEKSFSLPGHHFFQLFAWADFIEFEIDCIIEPIAIIRRDPDQDINHEKISALISITEIFISNLNNLIFTNSAWYNDSVDAEDRQLGTAITETLSAANIIVNSKNSYLNADPPGSNLQDVIKVFSNFLPSVGKVKTVCEALQEHYPKIFREPVLGHNLIPLHEFLQLAIQIFGLINDIISAGADNDVLSPQVSEFLAGKMKNPFQKFSISRISPDTVFKGDADKLEFTKDIEALASVISYREVTPPLAIGLFGNWGSGKSFFMTQLKEKITALSKDTSGSYCSNVVHVWFNSWYYSDANLWASLVTRIFDSLKEFCQPGESLDSLYIQLASQKELKQKADLEKEVLLKEKNRLQEQLREENEKISADIAGLRTVTDAEIIQAVLADAEVKKDIDNADKEIKGLMPPGFKPVNDIASINQSIAEIGGTGKRFFDSLRIVYQFKKNKLWKPLSIAVIAFLLPVLIAWAIKGTLKEAISFAPIFTGMVATGLSQLLAFIAPVKVKIDNVYNRLVSLKQTVVDLELKKRKEEEEKLQTTKDKISLRKEEISKKEKEIEALTIREQEIVREIADIVSGRKLTSFIEGRVSDQRYLNSLGIISWIRKDFEELDRIINEQRKSANNKSALPDGIIPILKIERIVLYIDDLDRCNEEIVVRVLEAIHLLLAFELFVVVVGVDPRWMHNALKLKYKDFLTVDKPLKIQVSENGELVEKDFASSYDYLEKIFQIPFALKQIDTKGRQNLIEYELKEKNVSLPVKTGNTFVGTSAESINTGTGAPAEKNTANNDRKPGPGNEVAASVKPDVSVVVPQTSHTAQLNISDEEIKFMKSICGLIGDSPRTIKRYINIYRIIRTHTNIDLEGDVLENYCAIMFLLAVITGLPKQSRELFNQFNTSDQTTLKDIVGTEDVPPDLLNAMKIKFTLTNHLDKEIGQISQWTLRRNIDLVSRFSFRSYAGEQEPVQLLANPEKINKVYQATKSNVQA